MKRALILGGAECVLADLTKHCAQYGSLPWLVIAANKIGMFYPGHLDHWVTMHPEQLAPWKKHRRRRGGNDDYVTWAGRRPDLVDRVTTHSGGSTGLFAAKVALVDLGCERVVLCGVPMDDTPHFIRGAVGDHYEQYRCQWEAYIQELAACVRSWSGWTRELLGAPTEEWLR